MVLGLFQKARHLAKKSKQPALDYGHFAKKLCDTSNFAFLRKYSKPLMWIVNVVILFYQLGMGSVAMLFIADNLVDLCGTSLGPTKHKQVIVTCTIVLGCTLLTNLFTKMRVVSIFALVSTFFFLIGLVFHEHDDNDWNLDLCFRRANNDTLPMVTLSNRQSQAICQKTLFFTVVDIFLMIQTLSGNAVALYVIFKIFSRGFNEAILNRFPKIPHFVVDKGFRYKNSGENEGNGSYSDIVGTYVIETKMCP
ncbi:unnamed protein product, partial [Mesorhabditis belari]|uniref:Amino acid transporter transmembrane domain-containing protein n=1 Tax=Mesorhabditis belari TaxID=2138241 RepID=A0AAF3EI58_9BILA